MSWRPRASAVLVAVLMAGCSSAGGDETDSAPVGTPAVAAADGVAAAVLDFSAPAVGGGEIDARSYAGSPVAFWFWAPY